ncbi:MAG: hypothetical protein IPL46_17655 [Saprospiraceae bacterium]|nr:hypothetical protein [Saprospiraceae bacterium]
MKYLILILLAAICHFLSAQDKAYYYEIPTAPESYSATSVAARLVDGLGFRYFWATEGLNDKDLSFKPSEDARTTYETIEHIHGLTSVLLNTAEMKPSGGEEDQPDNFEDLRQATLRNIQRASEILKDPNSNLEDMPMIFQRSNGNSEYPFWNLINGPICDALWHVGQVVTFRRSSGNPLPSGVSVLTGTKRD